MYYLVLLEKAKARQYLDGKSTDQLNIKAVVIVADNKLVQVLRKHLEDDAYMFPEDNEIFDPHNMRNPLRIILLDICQYFDLNKRLLSEFLFILYHFQSHLLFSFVIVNLENLSIRAFSNFRKNLITVSNVIVHNIRIFITELFKNYSLVSKGFGCSSIILFILSALN